MKSLMNRINGKLLTSMLLAVLAAGHADASTITIATGYSTAGSQNSAEAYKNVVEAAVAGSTTGYGVTSPAQFSNISNHGLFGANQNIAFDFTIRFGVTSEQAGEWEFRAGTDFGRGGAVFLDAVALGYNSSDMWWSGSYSNVDDVFDYKKTLAAGNHVLKVYGLEGCCDGSQEVQFRAPGSNFKTFSTSDGMTVVRQPFVAAASSVPEPASDALFAIALVGVGLACRRQR